MIYLILETQVYPTITKLPEITFIDALIALLLPTMTCYLLCFFIMFECITNGMAELTQFADREFYGDWWNSVSYADFARLWNKPVHKFLLRHCYYESMNNLNVYRV
jgi:sterol O-acyltransferase